MLIICKETNPRFKNPFYPRAKKNYYVKKTWISFKHI
jgi:hypothetical protein